ncbi:MAG: excinuclease ABC subunit UvrA [Acidobacteria bacterium]|jgi:excinuclease ABC subunit A|nr:excinuclease ABC subunit UvrA [Acidobacteriota bacterium]
MEKSIILKGIRTRNLKNIDVAIPLGKITALVGVSGAGKSSLAFHTLYAEGYIRYIESISPYIRQFLDQVEKPEFDRIDNLPPAVAFRQKRPHKNPRSLVATASDIFDYLRIMYAKIADFSCPSCGDPIRRFSIDEIITALMARPRATLRVCFSYQGDIAFLINRGYYFLVGGGEKAAIDGRSRGKPILVLIDELENQPQNRLRLFEAVDSAMALSRSTITVFDGQEELRFPFMLYCPRCQKEYENPDENLFSFNSARGACAQCRGFGDLAGIDPALVFDDSLSLAEGAVLPLNTPANHEYRAEFLANARRAGLDLQQPLAELGIAQKEFLLRGKGRFPGLEGLFTTLRKKTYKVETRAFLSRFTSYHPCPACGGRRFNPLVLSFRIQGRTIADFLAMTIGEADSFIRALEKERFCNRISCDVFDEIDAKLRFLIQNRLHYIQLDRPTYTLSRGEHQRINLAFIMGSTLSDSLLIIDQPSADLHPSDYATMKRFLRRLKENGNTVVLVEHNPHFVQAADHVIELGPRAGREGGRVIFSGPGSGFLAGRRTITQKFFRRRTPPPLPKEFTHGFLDFAGACAHNLKHIAVRVPRRALTVIVGVSGAGKSSLLYDEMYLKHPLLPGIRERAHIDPGVGSLRANTNIAGFLEASLPVREFFAALRPSRLLGYQPGHFSFHSPLGRCPECRGRGYQEIEMQFLPAVRSTCRHCRGNGFARDVLKVVHQGRSIADVLSLSVDEFCSELGPAIPLARAALQGLRDNGMGYLRLGEKLAGLSTGELQKLKLLKYLNGEKTDMLILLDEPSFGLHPYDVAVLQGLISRLLAARNTVVAVEHNLAMIAAADFVIELGPEGGAAGGRLLFSGTPRQLLARSGSPTGRHLKNYLQNT